MIPMRKRYLVLTLLLTAGAARAQEGRGLDLSFHYGADKYDAVGLRSGLGGLDDQALLKDTSMHLGATVIGWSGMGELGLIGEVGRPGKDGSTTLLGALAGLGFGPRAMRFEVLGELGAHRYGDVLHDARVVSRSRAETWLVSAGVRPGLSVRFGPENSLLLGVWTFARWDVTHEDVQVNLSGGGSSTYRVGGAQFGAAIRAGFSM